jgi:signal peptidase I
MNLKEAWKKVYWFLFEDDSIWSWLVNLVLAFVIVKFLIYPGLGFVLGTDLPLVAVVSGSMEHNGLDFDQWWDQNGVWYEERGITKEMFEEYKFKNGFNKGDVIVLVSAKEKNVGEVLVYNSGKHEYPIIHRVTYINKDENAYQIKGDNNDIADPWDVYDNQIIGKALFRIPYIGWLKIWFVDLTGL